MLQSEEPPKSKRARQKTALFSDFHRKENKQTNKTFCSRQSMRHKYWASNQHLLTTPDILLQATEAGRVPPGSPLGEAVLLSASLESALCQAAGAKGCP